MRTRRQQGFTLIEAIVVMVIMVILIALAAPNYALWLANSRVKTAAQGLDDGLNLARNEAIRRNVPVEFALTDDAGSWKVSVPSAAEDVQVGSGAEAGGQVTVAATDSAAGVLPATAAITFNGFGRVTANADATPSIARLDIAPSSLSGAQARPLRITVTSGGSIRLCDPSPDLQSSDPRACS